MSEEKRGSRNNAEDRKRLREIRQACKRAVDLTVEMEPDDEDRDTEDTPYLKADLTVNLSPEISEWVTVKAAGDWRLMVLGVPFGGPFNGKDSDGEFFSAKTDIMPDFFKEIPAVYYHGYTPDGKRDDRPAVVGPAKFHHTDEKGHWYEVALDRTKELAKRLWDAAKAGVLRASSGSIAHLVRKSASGEILLWPVAELSLIDAQGKRQPANPYAVALPVMKARYTDAGLNLNLPNIEHQPEATATGDEQRGAADTTDPSPTGELTMTDEIKTQIEQAVADALKAREEAAAKAQEAREIEALRKEVEQLKAAANRLPNGAPHVTAFADTAKFDNVSDEALALTVQALGAQRAPKAAKAFAQRIATNGSAAEKSTMKAFGLDPEAVTNAAKANELNYSTQSGYGDEFVGVVYSRRLWELVRAQRWVVDRLIRQGYVADIPEGAESVVIPVEGADPTIYAVAQATDTSSNMPAVTVTPGKAATANKTLTAKKLGGRILYTGELTEDSFIPWAEYARRKIEAGMGEALESAIIDGDTETGANANINAIGAAQTLATTAPQILFDGFRKLALVTNTANSVSASGSLSDTTFLAILQLLGTAGLNGADSAVTSFIVDGNVDWKLMQLAAVKTLDVFGGNATIVNGMLRGIYGYEVNRSDFMHFRQTARKVNSAGKIDTATDGNNTLGAILAVRWDRWAFGYARRMKFEVVRRAEADAWDVFGFLRAGLVYRDNEASAIAYNVGI